MSPWRHILMPPIFRSIAMSSACKFRRPTNLIALLAQPDGVVFAVSLLSLVLTIGSTVLG